MKTNLVEPELGFAFWPTPRMAAHWHSDLDPPEVREHEFDTLYGPVERFFADDHREIVLLSPLANLVVEGPCELEPGVVVNEFTRDELQLLIDRGILRGRFGNGITVDSAERGQRDGLRRVVRVLKMLGNDITAEEGKEANRILFQPTVDRIRILRTPCCCIDEVRLTVVLSPQGPRAVFLPSTLVLAARQRAEWP